MEKEETIILRSQQKHPKLALALTLGLVVFCNCFGFPVYNWNKEWPLTITALYLVQLPCWAVFTGGALAKLLPEKKFIHVLFLTAALTCAGLGCRFLLEFGEVSNTYNFTLPNVLFHAAVFLGVFSLTWHRTIKQGQTKE